MNVLKASGMGYKKAIQLNSEGISILLDRQLTEKEVDLIKSILKCDVVTEADKFATVAEELGRLVWGPESKQRKTEVAKKGLQNDPGYLCWMETSKLVVEALEMLQNYH